ncbi:hypothetical protein [Niabella ginsengisoli]|uniref:Uncharacterized protein n=1 Tax=Niabella ginsengisoli TaxID=522298 RepID=A0ABS9SMI2_9BACT|nr:hypothetical protein [Niabella ginsengisoli]MCH5599501.1 hypothetical protein [Niabella ginsengisoli]
MACKVDSRKQNIVRLELYNSLPLLLKEENVNAEQLAAADHKIFTDARTLKLVNDRILYDKVSVWKGHIYGKFIFEDNYSTIIKVSRYDKQKEIDQLNHDIIQQQKYLNKRCIRSKVVWINR